MGQPYLSTPVEFLIERRRLESAIPEGGKHLETASVGATSDLSVSAEADGESPGTTDSEQVSEPIDVLIVGSGYGGAIAAARLAAEGRTIVLLERGKEYLPRDAGSDLPGDFPDTIGQLGGFIRTERPDRNGYIGDPQALFDIRMYGTVNVVVGSGLGGTSLINANVALRPAREVFERDPWPRAFREGSERLAPYYERAREFLGIDTDTDRTNYFKYQALERTAERVAASLRKQWQAERGDSTPVPIACTPAPIAVTFHAGANKAGRMQSACTACGNCITGCNVGAKNTVAMNYLHYAHAKDVKMYTGATVLRVTPRKGGGWTVHFRRTVMEKHPVLGRETFAIGANTVILAAGTLGSTEILLRSRAAHGLQLSPMLGRQFSTNGDNFAAGYSECLEVKTAADLTIFSGDSADRCEPGPTITGCIHLRDAMRAERAPLIQDASIPTALGLAFGEAVTTSALPIQMTRRYFLNDAGAKFTEPLSVDVDALHRTQMYLMMGDDGAAGNLLLTWPEAIDALEGRESERLPEHDRARIAAYWPDVGKQPIFDRQFKVLSDAYDQKPENGLFVPSMLARPLPPAVAEQMSGAPAPATLTVHPLGGCPMGDDFLTGVVDKYGQVYCPPQLLERPREALVDPDLPTTDAKCERNEEERPVYAGLHVLDGSIVPTALGVNPFLTIAALAEHAAEELDRRLRSRAAPRPPNADPSVEPSVGPGGSPVTGPFGPEGVPHMTVLMRLLGDGASHAVNAAPLALESGPGLGAPAQQSEHSSEGSARSEGDSERTTQQPSSPPLGMAAPAPAAAPQPIRLIFRERLHGKLLSFEDVDEMGESRREDSARGSPISDDQTECPRRSFSTQDATALQSRGDRLLEVVARIVGARGDQTWRARLAKELRKGLERRTRERYGFLVGGMPLADEAKMPAVDVQLMLELPVPDLYAMMHDPAHETHVEPFISHEQRFQTGLARLIVTPRGGLPVAWSGKGLMWWPRRIGDWECPRGLRALWKWFRTRGLRESRWEHIDDKFLVAFGDGAKKFLVGAVGFWRMALHIGEPRQMGYEFDFQCDSAQDLTIVLRGTKDLRYTSGRNVWLQFTELDTTLELRDRNSRVAKLRGVLSVSVEDLARMPDSPRLVPLPNVAGDTPRQAMTPDGQAWEIEDDPNARIMTIDAPDTPTTIGAASSFGLFAARLLMKTHFWTFWAPEYRSAYARRDMLSGVLSGMYPTHFMLEVPKSWEAGQTANNVAPQYRIVAEGVDGKWNPYGNTLDNKAPRDKTRIVLTRYFDPANCKHGPVMLIHGLFASSRIFATDTINTNMVQFLCSKGLDVWLLDLRTSSILESVWDQTSFDVVAHVDIPAAVNCILEQTERKQLKVVAHCMGSAAFWISVLDGCLDKLIESAVCTQVGPYLIPSSKNRAQAYFVALMRDLIAARHVDVSVTSEASAMDVLFDRLVGSLPFTNIDGAHVPHCTPVSRDFANCNRATALDGPMWLHENLDPRSHARLDELLSVTNIRYYTQVLQFGLHQRVTDEQGRNVYARGVPPNTAGGRCAFPVRFIHGRENGVFDVSGAEKNVRKWPALFPQNPNSYKADLIVVPGYSHLDAIFGMNAHRCVFPYITDHFLKEHEGPLEPRTAISYVQQQQRSFPVTGPVIGWARRDVDKQCRTVAKLRILVEAECRITEWPIKVVVLGLVPGMQPRVLYTRDAGGWTGQNDDGLFAVDVKVPFDTHALLIRIDYQQPQAACTPAPDQEVHAAIDLARLPWWQRLIADGAASSSVAPAARKPDDVSFLFGTCRYPGSPFERIAADRIFSWMFLAAIDRDAPVDYCMMLGDQIYADATSDMFNTRTERERFFARYREAFTGTHMRRVLALLPVYFAVDDHEFENDYQGNPTRAEMRRMAVDPREQQAIERKRRFALQAYAGYQWSISPRNAKAPISLRNPARTTGFPLQWPPGRQPQPLARRLWYDFEIGGVPTFVMDTRTERRVRVNDRAIAKFVKDERAGRRVRVPNPANGRIASRLQFRALRAWLEQTVKEKGRGHPRFIASGSVVAPFLRLQQCGQMHSRNSDNWLGYPDSLQELVELLFECDAQNTIFLSGDYHLSCWADLTFHKDGKEDIKAYSLVSSGFYTPIPFANNLWSDIAQTYDAPLIGGSNIHCRYEAGLLAEEDNFVRVSLHSMKDGTAGWSLDVEATRVARDGTKLPPIHKKIPLTCPPPQGSPSQSSTGAPGVASQKHPFG